VYNIQLYLFPLHSRLTPAMDGLIHDSEAQPGLEFSPRRPEVVHPGYRGGDSWHNDMYQQHGTKEAASIDTAYIDAAYFNAAHMDAAYIDEMPKPTPPTPRICGFLTRTFWIVFALVLVVLGGAIGGGLGGGLLVASKGKHASTPQQQEQQQPQLTLSQPQNPLNPPNRQYLLQHRHFL
jgi:hypothetical protein